MRARSKCSLKKCLAQIQTTWRNVTYLILEGEKCSLTNMVVKRKVVCLVVLLLKNMVYYV